MNTDALKSIIEDAHKLAKADIAPDLVKPAVETIALRLERLVKDGFYVAPEAAREFAQARKDIMDGKSLNAILANPPFDCKLKMPVISMPGRAAIKYQVEDPERRVSPHPLKPSNPTPGKYRAIARSTQAARFLPICRYIAASLSRWR